MITINNIKECINFFTSVKKCGESCELNVSSDCAKINLVNEGATFRAYFHTATMTSDSDVSFCFSDISKFIKCLQTIKDVGKNETVVTVKNGTMFHDNHQVSFKLKGVKRDVIMRYISQPMKEEPKVSFGFTLPDDMMKKMISLNSINNSAKVYFSLKDGVVIGEIDDKGDDLTDSIGFPVSSEYFGEWSYPMKLKLDNFRSFNLMNADKFTICATEQKFIVVDSVSEKSNVKIICGVLKI
jgi:hypothetical protein